MKTVKKYVPLSIVIILASIFVLGVVFTMSRNRSETLKSKEPTKSAVAVEPAQTEIAVEDFFVQLPPSEAVECRAVDPEPIIAQNGNTVAPDPFSETPTVVPPETEKATTIRTLPPEHPIVENDPKAPVTEVPAAEETIVEPCKKSKWIPFVYFYRQSSCGRVSSPVYIMPITAPITAPPTPAISDEPNENAPMPCISSVQPPTRPLVPVFYGPMPVVGPIVPMVPVYPQPVFTPTVVPSRIGSPKLVYPNGVVIKPKVYFPNQPLKNTLRAVTP